MGPIERILSGVGRFYRTGADKELLGDVKEIGRVYERKRRSVFYSLLFGYSFFYVCRLSFSVAKKPMLESGVLDAEQMGQIGFAMYITYAFGKLVNGFLADRSNIARFMSTGLLVSSLIIICFGFNKTFYIFLVLWGINGWFQSMGSAPSGASLSQWFSNRERGTRYGLWSAAHSIGEGVTFAVTAVIVSYFGWRWGFWGAGGISLLVALVMFVTLADRPQTYGLPSVSDYKNDYAPEESGGVASVNQAQWGVIKNPYVWILGLSCVAMYVARYGVNSWGVLYLQEAKSYPLITAGITLSLAKIAETAGAISSGFVSDFFFRSRRNVTTLIYGLMMISGMIILFKAPTTFLFNMDDTYRQQLGMEGKVDEAIVKVFSGKGIELADDDVVVITSSEEGEGGWQINSSKWYMSWRGYWIEQDDGQLRVLRKYKPLHLLGISMFGFGLGGLLVFLGGLIAIDICSKKASGAAMGVVGMFSYIGAACQDWVSGAMLEANKMEVGERVVYDFTGVFYFWLGAAILAVVLSATLWNVKVKD